MGDELLVDDPARDVVMAQITSLETNRRVESAPAASVPTASGPGYRSGGGQSPYSPQRPDPPYQMQAFPAMSLHCGRGQVSQGVPL
ncbi:hypothetical protein [Methanothrix soehngenii]|uniref:hypothetical protein n=1 Tax=Methanothrix soehngenii TaxID=2223 RepID=UPI00300C6F71